ncbi:MAG: hypothetical protein OXN84_03655 [Albidovulum sp.]|nr:hypothetical protein [Albidovulum sp.]
MEKIAEERCAIKLPCSSSPKGQTDNRILQPQAQARPTFLAARESVHACDHPSATGDLCSKASTVSAWNVFKADEFGENQVKYQVLASAPRVL